jgi:ketosteroid isomerase-like protein
MSSNRDLVKQMTEAFLKGDLTKVLSLWHDDIIWYFPGRSIHSGAFKGKDKILKHLAPPQGVSMELIPKAYFGDEEYGAVLYETHTIMGDKTLTESRVMVCKVDDSKIVETRIYSGDIYAFDEFWE